MYTTGLYAWIHFCSTDSILSRACCQFSQTGVAAVENAQYLEVVRMRQWRSVLDIHGRIPIDLPTYFF